MSKLYNYAQLHCIKSVGKIMHQTSMISDGARIGIAMSGGVDSYVLAKVLSIRKSILPFNIELLAIHLNPGFDVNNHLSLYEWLTSNGFASHIEVTDYGLKGHSADNFSNSPCFFCARLRRKRLFELCDKYKLTHLALGHNAEDLVETFFLNLCRNGQVHGLSIIENMFKNKLSLIRPLLLIEKKYIIKAAKSWNLPVFANPCPSSGNSARSDMSKSLEHLYNISSNAKRCITNGLLRWEMSKYFKNTG